MLALALIIYSRHDHAGRTILLKLNVRTAIDGILELYGQLDQGGRDIAVLDNAVHKGAKLVAQLALHKVRHLLICKGIIEIYNPGSYM